MAANVQNAPGRTDWAEDSEPDLATSIPAPQVTKNKDGSETIITVFINEDGKKVKRTQRIRRSVIKKKENPRVAERRQWAKMGIEAGKPPGPRPDTTTLGENIMFRPAVGFKAGGQQEKAPEEDKKADALKKMQIKCRICSGDHFTTKCPFKDTMAPAGEDAAPADMDAAAGETAGGLGAGGSSYVPPHMRKGGAAATGERMGGKFERDDLATLRVTNVSITSSFTLLMHFTDLKCAGLRVRRRRRLARHVRALRPRHPCLPGQGPRDRQSEGLCIRFIRRPLRCCECVREDGWLRFRSLDSARRVRQEGYDLDGRSHGHGTIVLYWRAYTGLRQQQQFLFKLLCISRHLSSRHHYRPQLFLIPFFHSSSVITFPSTTSSPSLKRVCSGGTSRCSCALLHTRKGILSCKKSA